MPQPSQAKDLNQLLNPQPSVTYQLATISHQQSPTIIDARPLSPPATITPRKARRKGRIATLPKLHRDTVNRMLWNGVPYKNIVEALSEVGFDVTERNVSNWATGGYLEWRYEQDLVLENRLNQDHLVDHLRRDDASELPEVGLQAAATRLSQILLQKTARADDVERNLGAFSEMVDILCRLNREIATLQKQRDDTRRTLGSAHDPARIKDADETYALDNERYFSSPPSDSGLQKSAVPPLLPPIPTSETLADNDRAVEMDRQIERNQRIVQMMQAITGKKAPASPDPKSLLPPGGDVAPTLQPPAAPPPQPAPFGKVQ